jgi:hypothetical protein
LPSVDIGDVKIQVAISNITAVKLNENPPTNVLTFDVGAKLEEKERKSGQVTVIFLLTVGTKPNIAKYGIEGNATLTGKDADIEKLLEIDPDTKIPRMLYGVYQHIFTALYLIATLLETPYPPPDLFHSTKQVAPKVEISSAPSVTTTSPEQTAETKEPDKEATQ